MKINHRRKNPLRAILKYVTRKAKQAERVHIHSTVDKTHVETNKQRRLKDDHLTNIDRAESISPTRYKQKKS